MLAHVMQVDAVKRNCIKLLPHMLCVHLKRFEFDYETMSRWKVKDRFAFPVQIDMSPYTADGLAVADAAEQAEKVGQRWVPLLAMCRRHVFPPQSHAVTDASVTAWLHVAN